MSGNKISFRFKNDPALESVPCPGKGITLIDLKKSIIARKNLDENSEGVDLLVQNAQTGQVYTNDRDIVPRHSHVDVKVVPRTREYRQSVSRFDQRVQHAPVGMRKSDWADDMGGEVIPGLGPGQAPSDFPDTRAGSGLTAEEMDRLQSQLSTSGQQQPIMYQQASASSSAIGPASWASQSQPRPRRPIPREKANAIYNVPLKRPHGIPISMLQQVSNNEAEQQEGKTIRQSDAETLVTVKENASRFHEVKRQLGASAASIDRVRELLSSDKVPLGYRCALCNKLLKDAVNIPQSGRATCRVCAEREIMSNGFKSPFDPTVPVTVKDLTPAISIRELVAQYVRDVLDKEMIGTPDVPPEQPSGEKIEEVKAESTEVETKANGGSLDDEFGGDIFAIDEPETASTAAETSENSQHGNGGPTNEDTHSAKRQKVEEATPAASQPTAPAPHTTQAMSTQSQGPQRPGMGMPSNGMFMNPQMMMGGYGMPMGMNMMGYPMMGMNPMLAQQMMMRGNMMYSMNRNPHGNNAPGPGPTPGQHYRAQQHPSDQNGAGHTVRRNPRPPSPKPQDTDPLKGRLMTKEEYMKFQQSENGESRSDNRDRRSASRERRAGSRDRRAESRDRRAESRERRTHSRDRRSVSRERTPRERPSSGRRFEGRGRDYERSRSRERLDRARDRGGRERRPGRERDLERSPDRDSRSRLHEEPRSRRSRSREGRRRSRSRDRSSSRRKEKRHKKSKKERKRKHH